MDQTTWIGTILEYDIEQFLQTSLNDLIDQGARFTIVDKEGQENYGTSKT